MPDRLTLVCVRDVVDGEVSHRGRQRRWQWEGHRHRGCHGYREEDCERGRKGNSVCEHVEARVSA